MNPNSRATPNPTLKRDCAIARIPLLHSKVHIMRTLFQLISGSLTLTLCCANALAHDDSAVREKEFRYGY